MSGPKAVVIASPDPCTSLLAAAAIQAAVAVAEGYQRAAQLREARLEATEENRRLQDAARQTGRKALGERIGALETRLDTLQNLADSLSLGLDLAATRPERPDLTLGNEALAYGESLEALLARLTNLVHTEAARQQKEFPTPDDLELPDAPSPVAKSPGRRLLARLAHLGPPPIELAALAQELDATAPGERATLLATELRGRVQALAEAVQQQALQEAQAVILAHNLKNLGYQVEEIGHTLFVAGGVVHFRRPGWGDYQVRLRIAAKGKGANFNVVRAVDDAQAERSVLDHIAEDRWCAEFPALLRALEADGMHLTVTRHLAPGELPVQFVARHKLPAFRDEEESRVRPAPLARPVPK